MVACYLSRKKYKERSLENNGYINSHLCINAQTEIAHTEHDGSYTVITVPSQNKKESVKGNNSACFECVINDSKTMVISMHPGTTFTYSGYMLTHYQQLTVGTDGSELFVNIVSYNSKRLFDNLMESFRQEIKADKTTNPTTR